MAQAVIPRFARFPAASEGDGHDRADDEHEERLDQIPCRHAVPWRVIELARDGRDRRIRGEVLQAEADREHAEHREATEGIDRSDPLLVHERQSSARVLGLGQ